MAHAVLAWGLHGYVSVSAGACGAIEGERMDRVDAIQIGADFDGLTAALVLGEAGVRTVVLDDPARLGMERNPETGALTWPDLSRPVMLPAGLARLIARRAGPFRLAPLKGAILQLNSGEVIVRLPSVAATLRAMARGRPADAERYGEFVRQVKRYRAVIAGAMGADPNDGETLAGLVRRERQELWRLHTMSLEAYLARWFDNEALQAFLTAGAMMALPQGSLPLAKAPGSASLVFADPMTAITRLDASGSSEASHRGEDFCGFALRPQSGLGPMMASAIAALGGAVRLEGPPARIDVKGGRLAGVRGAGDADFPVGRIFTTLPANDIYRLLPRARQPEAMRAMAKDKAPQGLTPVARAAELRLVFRAPFDLSGLPDTARPFAGPISLDLDPSLDVYEPFTAYVRELPPSSDAPRGSVLLSAPLDGSYTAEQVERRLIDALSLAWREARAAFAESRVVEVPMSGLALGLSSDRVQFGPESSVLFNEIFGVREHRFPELAGILGAGPKGFADLMAQGIRGARLARAGLDGRDRS